MHICVEEIGQSDEMLWLITSPDRKKDQVELRFWIYKISMNNIGKMQP